MATKICTKCKEVKLLTAFGKDIRREDGLCYVCKACKSEYTKNNADKIRE